MVDLPRLVDREPRDEFLDGCPSRSTEPIRILGHAVPLTPPVEVISVHLLGSPAKLLDPLVQVQFSTQLLLDLRDGQARPSPMVP
jgi:hypothetical protein